VGHRAALIDVCFLATAFDFNSAMRASFIGALTIVDCEKHLNVLPHYQLAAHAFYGPDESILRYDESDTVFVGVTVSQHRAVPRTVFTRWNLSELLTVFVIGNVKTGDFWHADDLRAKAAHDKIFIHQNQAVYAR
jgi:hypothetical protein